MAKKITQIEINGETYDINGGGGGSAGNALKQVPNMATYTPTDGEIVQYIGATTADYDHGGLYEYGLNMTTFNIGANKAGIPQGTYRTKAAPTLTNIFASNYTGSDGNNYQGASQYNKLQVGDVAWNSSTYESFLITDVQNNGETLTLENGVTATYTNSTSGGLAQVYEIDGYYFIISDLNSIVSRAGVTTRSGFIVLSDVGSVFNNYSTAVVNGWFQIAEIGEGNVTVKKQGSTVQTFNVNQQWNTIIDLPDDVVMCKMLENKALASYATPITRFKYIEDHGWVDMDRSNIQYNEGAGEWVGTFVSLDIAEGEYYYDIDNDTVFVADENLEMQEVTSTVIIQGDTNKLYCNINTNQLYRYDGSNFVAIEDTSKAPNYPTFSIADTRENLLGNGESTTTLWGKIKKWFSDLKDLAFIGKPSSGQTTTYLRGDGTWQAPPNTTYSLSATNEEVTLTPSQGSASKVSLNTLINGLSLGNSDPQDDDYIISQYVNGGTTTTTYHRRPLSKFWNWIKSKLGIGTNDGTFLRKDGTWATPTATIYLGFATGNSLIAFIKTKISNGYKVGFLTADGSSVNGCPDSTNVWIIQYQCDTSMGNAIQLMAWCYGSAWEIRKGYAWNNNNNEPSWKAMAYAEDTFLVTRNSSKDTNNAGYWAAMCNSSQTGSPTLPTSGVWWHILSMDWSGNDTTNWISQLALPTNQTVDKGVWYRCNDTANKGINSSTWHRLAEADSSGNAKNANTVNGLTVLTAVPANAKFTDTNTWRPLGTGASDACAGNDSRLSNSRPASDVYAWAKASTKPSYTASEVGAQSATALTSSKTYNYGSNYCYAYKYGRVVYLSIILYNNGTDAGITLDATYRPIRTSYTFGLQSDSATDGWITATGNNSIITVDVNGVVQAKKSFAGTIFGNITYISAS